MEWCRRLWSEPFDHPDPVHNPPSRTPQKTESKCPRPPRSESCLICCYQASVYWFQSG
jgi:hypothetical protein